MKKLYILLFATVLLAAACNQTANTPPPITTPNPAPSPSSDWKNYTNTELGFSLVFTDPWKGYIAQKVKDGSIGFYVPTIKTYDTGNYTTDPYEQIFSISRWSVSEYDARKKQDLPSVGTEIGRDSNYVFIRNKRVDAYASNLQNKITESDIQAAISSFKIVK